MRPVDTCEACGGVVAADDAHRAELTIGDAMCPTPMVFHRSCYEQATAVWDEGEDSLCAADPAYPETQRWATFPGGVSRN